MIAFLYSLSCLASKIQQSIPNKSKN